MVAGVMRTLPAFFCTAATCRALQIYLCAGLSFQTPSPPFCVVVVDGGGGGGNSCVCVFEERRRHHQRHTPHDPSPVINFLVQPPGPALQKEGKRRSGLRAAAAFHTNTRSLALSLYIYMRT
eukprot:gene3749-2645_t